MIGTWPFNNLILLSIGQVCSCARKPVHEMDTFYKTSYTCEAPTL